MPCVQLRWPGSLRGRLLAVYGLSMGLSALLAGALVVLVAPLFSQYTLRLSAERFARQMSDCVEFGLDGRPTGFNAEKIEPWIFSSFARDVAVQIVDAQGRVVVRPAAGATALPPVGAGGPPAARGFSFAHEGVAMHAAAAPVAHTGNAWYVQLAISDRLVLQLRESFGLPALRAGIVATGIVFLAVFLVATHLTLQRILQPLRAAASAAQRITPRTLDARLQAGDLPAELAPLVDAFNRALDRLQAGFRTQQEFLANAAHELKTPLALIRAQVELGPAIGPNALLLQDIDRMARQIQQLLHLAEASEPRNYRVETVDPHAAIAEVCAFMDRVAERHGVRIAQQIDGAAPHWNADRGALFTLLKNLLENAIQHSPPGGVVTVLATGQGFSVADQGPGVPMENLGRLFDRFWRSAERRDDGAGLGLSICLEIARAHGWTIAARPGQVGLQADVRF
jgi:signal transduction histidine kinase